MWHSLGFEGGSLVTLIVSSSISISCGPVLRKRGRNQGLLSKGSCKLFLAHAKANLDTSMGLPMDSKFTLIILRTVFGLTMRAQAVDNKAPHVPLKAQMQSSRGCRSQTLGEASKHCCASTLW